MRQTVHEIVRRDLKLTPGQSAKCRRSRTNYYDRRTTLREQVAGANRELADALMADMAFAVKRSRPAIMSSKGSGSCNGPQSFMCCKCATCSRPSNR